MHKFTKILLAVALFYASFQARANKLELNFKALGDQFDGQIGICAVEVKATKKPDCFNGEKAFPLQSVMKLVVAAAVLDAADREKLKLGDLILVRPEDASPGPQEFANLVKRQGSLRTTIEDLMLRAVAESDSTSVDILIRHLGGVDAIQAFIKRKNLTGIRIDRNERDLQAESVGLTWREEYSDPEKFDLAIKSLSEAKRDAAWVAHLKDERDRATPLAMLKFLEELASERLLSKISTDKLLTIMSKTSTGPDRLKAGLPVGWTIEHKTGTGRTWKEVNEVVNDVGFLNSPDSRKIAIAVFIAGSRRPMQERAKVMAKAAGHVTKL